MPRPIFWLILNALYKGFQMRYHLFQKFFGNMVKIKETSLLSQPCWFSIDNHCNFVHHLIQIPTGGAAKPECGAIDNQYWSYGDYQTINDVSDFAECCRLCKDDSECQNFSWGKPSAGYANQCYKKKGGNAQSRSEFISSPLDISSCSCDDIGIWVTELHNHSMLRWFLMRFEVLSTEFLQRERACLKAQNTSYLKS